MRKNVMRFYLLPEEGIFYKANLHAHSPVSDGKNTPAELKKLYKAMFGKTKDEYSIKELQSFKDVPENIIKAVIPENYDEAKW